MDKKIRVKFTGGREGESSVWRAMANLVDITRVAK